MSEDYDVEKTWQTRAGHTAVCIVLRGMHRCGYVGITKKHLLYGVKYSHACELLKPAWEKIRAGHEKEENKRGPVITMLAACYLDGPENWSPDRIINVHGGLTYSGGHDDYPAVSKGLWWFGFDCGHHGDGYLSGDMERFSSGPVRSMEYVMQECESMSEQLAVLETFPDA